VSIQSLFYSDCPFLMFQQRDGGTQRRGPGAVLGAVPRAVGAVLRGGGGSSAGCGALRLLLVARARPWLQHCHRHMGKNRILYFNY